MFAWTDFGSMTAPPRFGFNAMSSCSIIFFIFGYLIMIIKLLLHLASYFFCFIVQSYLAVVVISESQKFLTKLYKLFVKILAASVANKHFCALFALCCIVLLLLRTD